MKLDGFCMDFIHMNVQLHLSHSFEITVFAGISSRMFMNPLDVELQALGSSETCSAQMANMVLNAFVFNFVVTINRDLSLEAFATNITRIDFSHFVVRFEM